MDYVLLLNKYAGQVNSFVFDIVRNQKKLKINFMGTLEKMALK